MYDQVTWSDIQRWEADEESWLGDCEGCGQPDMELAERNGMALCYDCEADMVREDERLEVEYDGE